MGSTTAEACPGVELAGVMRIIATIKIKAAQAKMANKIARLVLNLRL